MRQAILARISRRNFTSEPIVQEQQIREKIAQINAESGLNIAYMEDGSEAFASLRKSYGMFSGVRTLIVLKGQPQEHLAEKIGYYGEELVLFLTDLNLGTCWVAGTFDRSKVAVPEGESMLCVIPVGVTKEPGGKEKFLRRAISKNRKSAESRLIGYAAAPDWAKAGIEAVRYAPSAVNSQKPVFRWEGNTLTASVPDTAAITMVDLGIAKKHFEIEAGGTFAFGNGAALTKE